MSRVVGEQRAYVPCGWMLVDAEEACMAGAGPGLPDPAWVAGGTVDRGAWPFFPFKAEISFNACCFSFLFFCYLFTFMGHMECSRRLWASGIGMMGKSDLVRPGLRGVEYAESESAQQVSSRVLAVTGQRSVARGVLGQASGRHPRVAGWGSCLSRGGGHRENPRALLTAPSGAGRLQAWPELGPHAPCPGEPSRCPFCCLRLGLVLGTFMPPAQPATGEEGPFLAE